MVHLNFAGRGAGLGHADRHRAQTYKFTRSQRTLASCRTFWFAFCSLNANHEESGKMIEATNARKLGERFIFIPMGPGKKLLVGESRDVSAKGWAISRTTKRGR